MRWAAVLVALAAIGLCGASGSPQEVQHTPQHQQAARHEAATAGKQPSPANIWISPDQTKAPEAAGRALDVLML